MNKPLINVLSLLAGLIAGFLLVLPKSLNLIMLLLFSFILVCMFKRSKNNRFSIPVLFFIIGLMVFSLYEMHYNFLESSLDENVVIQGKVYDMETKDGKNAVTLTVNRIKTSEKIIYPGKKIYVYTDKVVNYGDTLILKGTLSFPSAPMNFGDFNYKNYLKSENIMAFLYTPTSVSVHRAGFSVNKAVKTIRDYFNAKINNCLGEKSAAFTSAVVAGYKPPSFAKIEDDIRKAGVSHVTAVSGMHVSVFMTFLLFVLNFFTKKRKTKAALILSILIFYALLTGLSPSVIRAVIMNGFALLGIIFGRQTHSLYLVSFTACLMLLFNPFLLASTSFMLSFIATATLVICTPILKVKFPSSPLIDVFVMTVLVNITTLPYILWNFGSFSLVGILANLVIVPLVPFVFIGGLATLALGFLPPLSFIAGIFTNGISNIILSVISFSASLPHGQISIMIRNIPFLLAYSLLFILIFLWLCRKKDEKPSDKTVFLCYTLIISLCFSGYLYEKSKTKSFSVTYLYVGQGDCAVINIPGGQTILVDTGDIFSGNSNALNYLKNTGIKKLDGIMISHTDSDHMGALSELLSAIPTKTVYVPYGIYLPEKLKAKAEKLNTGFKQVTKGDKLSFGDVCFNFLHPKDSRLYSDNNGSMVINLTYNKRSFLFMGDLSSDYENTISENASPCDVLKVSHHGSSTATSNKFVKSIKPHYALISCGKDNIYSHPSEKVYNILSANNVKTFITAKNGCVKFTVLKNGKLTISTAISA